MNAEKIKQTKILENEVNVAFIGNPNCGKTTLFNAYTGAKLKVANWPGVTVEKKEGCATYHNHKYKLVDLPGTYSLTSYTMEEILSRNYIMESDLDVIIDVVDASSLERSLYLTLQLIELGKPVVLALNMMDIVAERGMEIDLHRLPEMLGIPVVPVCARKRTGLNVLMHAVFHHKDKLTDPTEHHHEAGNHIHDHHGEYVVVYSDEIEDKIDKITELLEFKYPDMNNYRWHALKILEQDEEILNKYPLNTKGIIDRSYESDIINQKYDFIEEIISEVLVNKNEKSAVTDEADKILTHRIWGLPVFLMIMAAVFFLTFTVGDFLKGYFETALEYISGGIGDVLLYFEVHPTLISLVVDGIIAGVGGILTFLPNIIILFTALAFLEDSGYMSRVAYVMDSVMGKIGLSGRAFIPMLLGFGCTVPAIMASRTLENKSDRIKTIIITPFMSCSARLPIYVFLSQMFFGDKAYIAATSMYFIGIIVAVLVAKILSKMEKSKDESPLLIELPEYKSPNFRTVSIYVGEKVKDYLVKAGTVIFVASVILWFVLNYGPNGAAASMADSFGAYIGKFLVPVMRPAGLDQWQIIVSLISGISAKEVVVSSMSVLYGVGNAFSPDGINSISQILSSSGFGALNAYSMMLFCLLYVPCAATIGAVYKETQSFKTTVFSVALSILTAWLVSTAFYQIAGFFF